MNNTAIIIPTRLEAKRFPNKPLAKINNIPMIVHVFNRATESKAGDVFVATPDKEIFEIVKKYGGQVIMTKKQHLTGSDRVYEAFETNLKNKADLIINLQGDMPNIKPSAISKLEKFMRNKKNDIGTLCSPINDKEEIYNSDVVKVEVDENLDNNSFLNAKDFFRIKKT